MSSTYRRDHQGKILGNDEWLMVNQTARGDIVAAVNALVSLYPTPIASSAELLALHRACARFLIDSGKASDNGVLAA